MRFIDLNDGHIYTLADLKKDWQEFRAEDPENHADRFQLEFFEILMATINGRNDLEILGLTHREVSNLTIRLRAQLLNQVRLQAHKPVDFPAGQSE